MLSERDYSRIVREMDRLKGVDAVEFLRETSPWFDLLEPAVMRAAKLLEEVGFYALYGLRPLPLYGVPYAYGEIKFAVKVDDERKFLEKLRERGFQVLSRSVDGLEALDAQNNRRIAFEYSPKPLRWDEEVVRRMLKKMGVRILSAEDFAAALLSRKDSVMMAELAAKVIYANMGEIDLEYLRSRASELSAEDRLEEVLEGLRKASSR